MFPQFSRRKERKASVEMNLPQIQTIKSGGHRLQEKATTVMKANETKLSQCHNVRRIGKALSSLSLALGLCSAGQPASANDHFFVPPGPWDGIHAPGIPLYAQIGFDFISGTMVILHDEEWAAIPFYRDVNCVPPDFNLLNFDPIAWDCALLVQGPEIWPADGIGPVLALTQGPVEGFPAPTVYLVKYTEVLAAVNDGVLTIGELQALPSLKIGRATFWSEVNSSLFTDDTPRQYKVVHYDHQSRGNLVDDPQYQTFSDHFTTGGRFGKSPKAYPNLLQAEIRFGQ